MRYKTDKNPHINPDPLQEQGRRCRLRRLARLILTAVAALAAFAVAAEPAEIRGGSELDFRPYCFTDKDGQPTGFGVDLLEAVADKMGLQLRITSGPWDKLWDDLTAGRLDVLPVVARTPGRELLVDFSLPHTETFDAFFRRASQPDLPNLAAAAGKEIVVLRSDAAHHELLEQNFDGKVIPVDSIPDGLRLIAGGKHDAFLCSKIVATLEIQKHGIRGLTAGPPIPDYKRVFSFGISKGHPELVEKLNQGLLIVKASGQYDAIYRRWLTVEDPWHKWVPYFGWAVAGLIVLAGLVVVLQGLVHRRTRQLAYANQEVQAEVAERRKAQEALQQLNMTLEQRVTERTAELQKSRQAALDLIRDVEAARVQAEQTAAALRESEGFKQAILDSLSAHVAVLNQRGIVLAVNESWRRFARENEGSDSVGVGIGADYVGVCRLAADRADPMAKEALEGIEAVLTGRRPEFTLEYPCHSPTQPRWFLMNVVRPVGNARGVVIMHMDITERKQAEETLRASEEKYRIIVETANEGIWITDAQRKTVFVNQKMADMLGYTLEEIQGKTPADFLAAGQEQLAEETREELKTGSRTYREFKFQRKDGSDLWILSSASPVLDEHGGYSRTISMLVDITERKRGEDDLKQLAEELKRSNADLEQFAYAASHDLREPLRAIHGFIELLGTRYADKLDDRGREYIQFSADGAKRMDALLTGLLNYSRVGTRGKAFSPISAGIAFRAAMANLQFNITQAQAVITSDDLPTVNADGSQLTQLFQNLIANAIKFKNEKNPQIHVGCQKQDGFWRFSIRDNGIGIDPQFSERIFLIFQRLHTRDKYPGHGIGLSICKKIIERHGGKIWVESTLGQGSTFCFTVPDREEISREIRLQDEATST